MRASAASFLFLVLALVVVVEVIHGARFRPSRARCTRDIQLCTSQFHTGVQRFKDQEPDVDEACQLMSTLRECMGSCMFIVMRRSSLERAGVKVLEYICNSRDEAKQVLQAECFTNGSFKERFEDEAKQCVQTMASEMAQKYQAGMRRDKLCPLVHDVMGCIDGKVEDICGEEVVPFVNRLINIVIREMLIGQMPNCFNQVNATHTLVKRAVEYFNFLRI